MFINGEYIFNIVEYYAIKNRRNMINTARK